MNEFLEFKCKKLLEEKEDSKVTEMKIQMKEYAREI